MTTKARKTKTNLALKVAIVRSGRRSYDVARLARMREDRLSQITQGHRAANPDEQKALARVLGCDIAEIFPITEEAIAS